jgi:hypothetical protein
VRKPLSLTFHRDEADPRPLRPAVFPHVVDQINALHVPRYGLGLYVDPLAEKTATPGERKQIENLGRAGKRLMGFCRTNLFKRLESSGFSFLQSIDRHILRNQIYLYAIEHGLDLPVGVLDAGLLDLERVDEDADGVEGDPEDLLDGMVEAVAEEDGLPDDMAAPRPCTSSTRPSTRNASSGCAPACSGRSLAEDLAQDTQSLGELLRSQGEWDPAQDHKLQALRNLLTQTHGKDKVLIFTQFADTARYLAREARKAGITHVEVATGASADPYALACRFSPKSNNKTVSKADEVRVLICTDVLSEGQNLQDSNVVVNFDLPWAIIRLIQRAGRVDRIGQRAEEIHCYSFLPADGVEQLIQLRSRIRQRLLENAEVVGTDEAFFEDEEANTIRDLYTEQAGGAGRHRR